MYEQLSKFSFLGGIVSIFISLALWFGMGDKGAAVFVGLWAPTMFAFSTCARNMHKDKS